MALDAVDIAIIEKRKTWVRTFSVTKSVPILWKRLIPAFLAIFSDETTDVEESSAAFIFPNTLGSLPQEPDGQPSGHTNKDHSCDYESGDVKTSRGGNASSSGEDANRFGCH